MAATVIITATSKEDEAKKQKALQFMANNLSLQQVSRLEEMARSSKAREMLDQNWEFLKSFI